MTEGRAAHRGGKKDPPRVARCRVGAGREVRRRRATRKRKIAMELLLHIELAHDDFVHEPTDASNPGPYTRYHHAFDDHTVPDVGLSTQRHRTLGAMFTRFD